MHLVFPPFRSYRFSPLGLTITALTSCILIALGVIAIGTYGNYKSGVKLPLSASDQTATPLPSPTLDPLRPYAIALLGYGGAGHQGGSLTDTMIVARIDPRRQTIHLISVPRDIWVSLPTGSTQTQQGWKLNAAFAIGNDDASYPHKPSEFTGPGAGARLAEYALKQVTGVPIVNVVAVNFYGFVKAIDTLGGIEVEVDHTFDDYWYPLEGKQNESCGFSPEDIQAMTATLSGTKLEEQFGCRYEHLHFDAGQQTMDGETALKFVRSRHGEQDGNDFGRSARQRKVVLAVRDKVFQINFLPKAIPFITNLASNIQTDLSLSDWQQYLSKAEELRSYEVINLALTDKTVLKAGRSSNGQFILLPQEATNSDDVDWSSVHAWLKEQFSQPEVSTSSAVPESQL